jgi:hypothetical protein
MARFAWRKRGLSLIVFNVSSWFPGMRQATDTELECWLSIYKAAAEWTTSDPEWFPGTEGTYFAGKPL